MNMLQGFNEGGGRPPMLEKIIRWVPFVGLGIAGMVFFNKIAPFFIKTFDNVTSLVGSFAAAAGSVFLLILVIHFISKQWDVLSKGYMTFCRNATRAFLKIDPLGYLESYVEKMVIKRKNLQATIVKLDGKKVNLERQMLKLDESIQNNMKTADAASKKNRPSLVDTHTTMAERERKSMLIYKPIYDRMVKNLDFLNRLAENWDSSIVKLKHEIQTKRTEYEMITETFKGISEAEGFANADSEEARNFRDSILLLEESVTQKIASIDDFEKRVKPAMDTFELEKQVDADEGMKLLEQWQNNTGLFQEITSKTVEGSAQVLESKLSNDRFAKFLKK